MAQDPFPFLGWVPNCDPAAAKERLDVEYVLIDHRFPSYNLRAPSIYLAPDDPWGVTAATPWLVKVFERDSTVVWRIVVARIKTCCQGLYLCLVC